METQSRSPAHFSVHDGSEHLALEPAERRRFAEMEVLVQRSGKRGYEEVDAEDLEDSRYDSSISATSPPEEELAQSSNPVGYDGQDICHCVPLSPYERPAGNRCHFFIAGIKKIF